MPLNGMAERERARLPHTKAEHVRTLLTGDQGSVRRLEHNSIQIENNNDPFFQNCRQGTDNKTLRKPGFHSPSISA